MTPSNPLTTYGLTPVPSSASDLPSNFPPPRHHPTWIPLSSLQTPQTPLATRINTYALANLPTPTYNHSHRVYHYGLAIKKYRFAEAPEWAFSDETWFCACLLHDIGTTEGNLTGSRLSFEFVGGLAALGILQDANGGGGGNGKGEVNQYGDLLGDGEGQGENVGANAPKDQAESIAEAIMRHQDLCEKGNITALGQLLQLATILGIHTSLSQFFRMYTDKTDNTGQHASLIHPSTIEEILKQFPRMKWSSCFTATIRRENSLKPWAHSTTLGEEFPASILGNTVMQPYE